jgi:hypothetical protein
MLQNHSHCSNGNRDLSTTTMDTTSNQDLSCDHASAVTLYEFNARMTNERPTHKNYLYPTQIESRKYPVTIPPYVYKNRDIYPTVMVDINRENQNRDYLVRYYQAAEMANFDWLDCLDSALLISQFSMDRGFNRSNYYYYSITLVPGLDR